MAADDHDDDDDLEDEFAAFEREAKAAAAAAMSGMAAGAKAKDEEKPVEQAEVPAPVEDVEEDDEEDEFAAFEREAKAAAATAMGSMGGGASGGEAKASDNTKAEDAPSEAATPEGASPEDNAAPVDRDKLAKEAALAAAAGKVAAKSEEIFGTNAGAKSQTILVVGGGIAGVTAAIEAAETGYDVVLLEKGPALGGRVTMINRYFPKMCHPNCGLEINYQRIRKNPRVKIITMAEVTDVTGTMGDFTVSVTRQPSYVSGLCDGCGQCAEASESKVSNDYNYGMDEVKAAHLPHEHAFPMQYVIHPSVKGTPEEEKITASCAKGAIDFTMEEESFELNAGAIIWATGWKPYNPSKLDVYSYDMSPDIINNVEMERLSAHDGPTEGKIVRPSDGEPAKRVALIQCAGSRDINHLAYCSMICCLASLKHAAYIREQYEDAEVDIYYIDIRAHDKMSQFYERVRRDEAINFIKSKPGHIKLGEDGKPVVCGELTIDREIYQNPYDLVVLATGMESSLSPDFAPAGMVRDDYGFVIDSDGHYAAGTAGGPFDVALSTQSATAAALKAIQAVNGRGLE